MKRSIEAVGYTKAALERASAVFRSVLRQHLPFRMINGIVTLNPPYVAKFERIGTARHWAVYRKSDGMTFGVGATLEAAIECARLHPYAR